MLDKEKILNELSKFNITENDFSCNEGLKPDAYIIENLDGYWKFFYNDEKGNQTDEKFFKDKKEAISFLIKTLKEEFNCYNN